MFLIQWTFQFFLKNNDVVGYIIFLSFTLRSDLIQYFFVLTLYYFGVLQCRMVPHEARYFR